LAIAYTLSILEAHTEVAGLRSDDEPCIIRTCPFARESADSGSDPNHRPGSSEGFDAGFVCGYSCIQCRWLRPAGGFLTQRKAVQRKNRSAPSGELCPMPWCHESGGRTWHDRFEFRAERWKTRPGDRARKLKAVAADAIYPGRAHAQDAHGRFPS